MSRRFVDLSHPIVAGMTTYPGLPGPEIETFISRKESASRLAPGVSFHIGRICMVANTGTYMDAPFHFFSSGADTAGLPLNGSSTCAQSSSTPGVTSALRPTGCSGCPTPLALPYLFAPTGPVTGARPDTRTAAHI